MPKFEYTSESTYTYPGEVVRVKKTKPREIELPLIVKAGTNGFRNNVRRLENAFSYDLGPGMLKVVTSDDKIRVIPVYYSQGMDFEESTDTGRVDFFYMFVITFTAYSPPYWYNPIEKEVWGNAQTTGEMGVSNLNTPLMLYNEGDVPAWPVWSLCGAFTEVEIQNVTTGLYFDYLDSVTTSQRVYIDMRAGHMEVMKNHVLPVFQNITLDSSPFPLMPGPNKIVPTFTGSDSNAEWRVRWAEQHFGI